MPLTPTDVDNAVPTGGTPSRALTNAALKTLINDIADVGVGLGIGTVNTFVDLPAPGTVTGQRWWVRTSTGVWLVNRKTKGAYYSDGATWSYLGDFPVSAAEVGFTPGSGISATNTQAAIEEVVADTAALLAGKAATGAVTATGITMSTARLLGRSTAATGAIEEITLGTNLSFTGTTLNAAGGGGGSPGGSTTQVQFNNAGSFGGASNVLIEGNELRLPAIAVPTAPAADGVKLYSTSLGGRILPTFLGPSGISARIQPAFATNRVGFMVAAGTGTSPNIVGLSSATGVGTATAASVATTNLYTSMRRLEYLVTVAATTAVAGVRIAASMFFRGNGTAGVGGYHVVWRGGPATGPSTTAGTMRMFMGLGPNSAPTDVNPSTLINIIGLGCDAADANLQIMHNDGTGTATKVDLGASFAKPTTDRTDVYELALFTPPNGSTVTWTVLNIRTGATASGTISTDQPANNTLLTPYSYCSVGGTSSVVGFNLVSIYAEVDN